MPKQSIQYEAIFKPVEFKPEFLQAQAKRQTELHMAIQALDDEMELRALEDRYRPLYVTSLWPLLLIPLGTVIGGIAGVVIVQLLIGAK